MEPVRRTNKGALEARKEGRQGSAIGFSHELSRTDGIQFKVIECFDKRDQSWYESVDLHLANSSTESGRLLAHCASISAAAAEPNSDFPPRPSAVRPSVRPSDHPSVRPSLSPRV